jgi:DNA mismatch repair ATPase MutS
MQWKDIIDQQIALNYELNNCWLFTEDGPLAIEGGRHPVLETMLSVDFVVPDLNF